MKKILSLTLSVVFGLAILTACQTVSTTSADNVNNANKPANAATPKTDAHGHADAAPRITLADAKKDFDAGNAIFVDTRGESAYKNEHIKSAINLTMETVEQRYKEIPTGKKIIAYCS